MKTKGSGGPTSQPGTSSWSVQGHGALDGRGSQAMEQGRVSTLWWKGGPRATEQVSVSTLCWKGGPRTTEQVSVTTLWWKGGSRIMGCRWVLCSSFL